MERITSLIEKLADFRDNINSYLGAATEDAEETILEMNIRQLYDYGERRDGSDITPHYSPVTVAIKREKGQRTDHVTLRDTFDWQLSFWIQYTADGFEIKASDWKTERLIQKYGEGILGLQDANVQTLCENIYLPRLITELKNKLDYA